MTQFIFNNEGVGNVKNMPTNIQEQYKGAGVGSVWILADGTIFKLHYNCEGGMTEAERSEFATLKEQGGAAFDCIFSSGQIILIWKCARHIFQTRNKTFAEDTNQDFMQCDTFGIDPLFVLYNKEIVTRQPSSCGTYNHRDGLYWNASTEWFEFIQTEPLTE